MSKIFVMKTTTGKGRGLAISAAIAIEEARGGCVRAEAGTGVEAEGVGAVVHVTLPRHAGEHSA
jgi:hypothetical protein